MSVRRFLTTVVAIAAFQLTAFATDTASNEPGTFKIRGGFRGVSFSRTVTGVVNNVPQHAYSGVSGLGILKNDKDKIIAESDLRAVEGLLGLRATEGATFFYVPLAEKYSTPDWRQEENRTSKFATLRYGKDNRWQVMNSNFVFLIKPGGFGSVGLALTASITRKSVIQLPAGTFKMFGYTIDSKKDGATVKFSYGKIVATTNCTAREEKGGDR